MRGFTCHLAQIPAPQNRGGTEEQSYDSEHRWENWICGARILSLGKQQAPELIAERAESDPAAFRVIAATPLDMTAMGVRRENAALSSGCKSHPVIAPTGSSRSGYGGNEIAEAFGKLVTIYGDSADMLGQEVAAVLPAVQAPDMFCDFLKCLETHYRVSDVGNSISGRAFASIRTKAAADDCFFVRSRRRRVPRNSQMLRATTKRVRLLFL
jgi:hypothetical protein